MLEQLLATGDALDVVSLPPAGKFRAALSQALPECSSVARERNDYEGCCTEDVRIAGHGRLPSQWDEGGCAARTRAR